MPPVTRSARSRMAAAALVAAAWSLPCRAQEGPAPEAPPGEAVSSSPATKGPAKDLAGADRRWRWDLDGHAFFTYNQQGGSRGETDFESQNHIFLVGHRHLRKGRFGFNGDFSFEPATIAPGGSPQLFQSGRWDGSAPVVDFQYGQDLIVVLEGFWETPVGNRGDRVEIAAGPIGSAALGPVPYWRRRSAAENPTAPLGYWWLDATATQQSVVRGTWRRRAFSFEASAFQGREFDTNPWDFDALLPNSWAARLGWDPQGPWSGQASYGVLHDHEPERAGNDHRLTASASYERDLRRGFWALTFAWGRSDGPSGQTDAILAESTFRYRKKNFAFGRVEYNEKPDLSRVPGDSRLFQLMALTLGLARDLKLAPGWDTGLGADLTFYDVPVELEPDYGSNPSSFHFFLRVRPSEPKSWGQKGNVERAGRTLPPLHR